MKTLKLLLILVLLLAAQKSRAGEYYESHVNARAMALGNAFTSLVEDDEALFYNPAGIAKNGGVFWKVADPRGGFSSMDALKQYSNLSDPTLFSTTLQKLYGKPIYMQGGGKTAVSVPFFMAAYYVDIDASIMADNPVSPTLDVSFIKDSGVAFGTGFPIGPFIQYGIALKRITREGSRKSYGPSVIADVAAGTSDPDVIFRDLLNKGTGYAMDMGWNFTFPAPVQPTFSLVWKNIGNTKFTPALGSEAPPTEQQEWILGSSLMVDLGLFHIAPSLDFKHANDTEEQLGKKVHLGVEFGLPLLDLRVGLNQGYLSYGAGIDLGFLQVDAASWGTEVGGYPGQLESRRFMIQASIVLGLDFGLGASGSTSAKKAAAAGGSSGKAGSRTSSWGRKVKQRR